MRKLSFENNNKIKWKPNKKEEEKEDIKTYKLSILNFISAEMCCRCCCYYNNEKLTDRNTSDEK